MAPLGWNRSKLYGALGIRARALLCLVACVLPALYVTTLRPRLSEPALAEGTWERGTFRVPSYLPGDCAFYRATADSLLRDRDLDLRNNAPWSVLRAGGNVAVASNGAWLPKHPILLPIIAAPLYASAGDPGLLVFNVLQLLALEAILLLFCMRVTRPRIAFATTLLFAFGTLLRPFAYNFSPDLFSTLLVASAMFALVSRRPALSGALLGLSVAAKWTNLIFFAPAIIACWTLQGRRGVMRAAATATPVLLALGVLNWHWFGSPFILPYDRVMLSYAGGAPVLEESPRDMFDVPFWSGLWTQITDRRQGLLISAPPLFMALPGFIAMWRRGRLDTLLLGSSAILQIALFAPYRQWSGSSDGHRFLMTAIALCAPAVAVELERLLDDMRRRLAERQGRSLRERSSKASAARSPRPDPSAQAAPPMVTMTPGSAGGRRDRRHPS